LAAIRYGGSMTESLKFPEPRLQPLTGRLGRLICD
jgi:hypothetical protein